MALRFFAAASVFGLLASCQPSAPVPPGPAAPPAAPTLPAEPRAAFPRPDVIQKGTVTYCEGRVTLQTSGEVTPLDAGDVVTEKDVVKTGPASVCEIQFSQFGVIHLGENTTVSLATVRLGAGRKVVDVDLTDGKVVAKVSKLVGYDRFQISTQLVQCGVRGTKFSVEAAPGQQTAVAVEDGTVALIPATFQQQKLEDAAPDPESVQAAGAKLRDLSTSVSAGHETVVTAQSMAAPAQSAQAVAAALETTTPSADALTQALTTYRRQEAAQAPAVHALSEESEKTFQKTSKLTIEGAVSATPAPASPKAAPQVAKALHLVSPSEREAIDINKHESIEMKWVPIDGAVQYLVKLYRGTGPSKTQVRAWVTPGSSVTLDRFDDLGTGDYLWAVVPSSDTPALQAQGDKPVEGQFSIVKPETLPAPVVNLPSAPGPAQ